MKAGKIIVTVYHKGDPKVYVFKYLKPAEQFIWQYLQAFPNVRINMEFIP